ncbi:mercuric transport protein MerTP [Croceitalea vernalis]|uniref:Mercuric transport protein MerT n=1 Tax=Croceitalea vernalis TaxID=3075599 RepID=A0ABU3BHG2_9FLAO|nr:mercuric transport protein MerTP [Croceitalea sp. P007]MDT0621579.1 mercuric transport protein MerTP [Croceitalea sp. P007]
MSSEKKLIGTTIITAIAASLCCITPVLALIAGTSGIASTFSWIEPFRPYLITITIVLLAIVWYQKLKPKKEEIDCECEDDNPKFINSKKFLFLITLFTGLMLAFPNYSEIFFPSDKKEVVYVSESDVNVVEYKISGMTCAGCEVHIESEVNKLDGIIEVKANYENGNTVVKFDRGKVTNKEIEVAVGKTGYKIIE